MRRSRHDFDSSCPACSTTTRQAYLFSKNGCDIYRCRVCGLGRTDVSGFDPHGYYTKDYFTGGHTDGYADYLASEAVLRAHFRRELRFVRRYRPSGRLFEIGCAYGFFLQEAKRNFDVSGIELAEDAVAHCVRMNLNVRRGVADVERLAGMGPIDVVVLFDVIEHLPDPFETLDGCAKQLSHEGIIVLTTGDFGSLLARLAGRKWRLMTPPQHLWFFTAHSFRNWAARAGMRVEAFDHPAKIVPLGLIAFQLGRMFGIRLPAGTGNRIGVPVNLFDAARIVLRKGSA
jgi:2-polyprenyl-3-methyl-5-hydroxy-6-metoxy-1,4-benzoquinol methylase